MDDKTYTVDDDDEDDLVELDDIEVQLGELIPDESEEKPEFGKRAEKRIKGLIQGRKDLERDLAASQAEKVSLVEQVKTLETKYTASSDVAFEEHKSRLDVEKSMLEAKLVDALDEADNEKAVEFQSALAKNQARQVRLDEVASSRQREDSQPNPPPDNRPKRVPLTDRQRKWVSDNRWFNSDKDKTVFALDVHKKLYEQGYDTRSEEYFAEIDKRVEHEFPTTSAKRRTPTVSGVSRSGSGGKGRKISLTKSEVEAAKRMGVPIAEWAKQKALLEGREDA